MKLPAAPASRSSGQRPAHLTYCTNIHPGESWSEVRDNLERHVLAVKQRVSPDDPFGVGLRLSARAAGELASGQALAELQHFLQRSGLYVFTINGFPHGAFHAATVKQRVYLPDWRDAERLRYSDELAELLAALLPEGMVGSISTVPGAYAAEVAGDAAAVEAMAAHMRAHAQTLARIEQRTGKRVTLALEPEPDCFLETIDQAVTFFDEHLHTGPDAARMRRHLGLCLDTCHAAVEFEDAAGAVERLRAAGIEVFKLQLSAGLRIARVDASAREALTPYLDQVYLHQVVARAADGELTRYPDLPQALAARDQGPLAALDQGPLAALDQRPLAARDHETLDRAASPSTAQAAPPEWRVHFHVPIFLERLERFESTQPFLREILALQRARPISQHLEVETYTWDVLPAHARTSALDDAIARELRFCIDALTR